MSSSLPRALTLFMLGAMAACNVVINDAPKVASLRRQFPALYKTR